MSNNIYNINVKSFINPYNFVTTGKVNRKPVNEYEDDELHTGVLECELTTKTPLAVPGKIIKTEDGHNTYEFFKINGKYTIPGSSLRGAVRNIYETITNSCFSTAKVDQKLTTRLKHPNKPGILVYENGEYYLYEARRYRVFAKKVRNNKDYKYGAKVYFDVTNKGQVTYLSVNREKSPQKEGYLKEGYLYIGEGADDEKGAKRYESIFELLDTKHEISENALNCLKETIAIYNDKTINKKLEEMAIENYVFYKQMSDEIKKLQQKEEKIYVPVWYDKITYEITAACIGRKILKNTMGAILKDKVPCTSRESLCPACALFGMDDKGGKIRITDAVIGKEAATKTGYVTLRELAGPKMSYLPFYIDVPENGIWSYDANGISIKGRKYYWHNTSDYYKSDTKTNRNSTMELVYEGTTFKFKVYYDQITETQLDELKWCLTLGNNLRKDAYCYKIGHGKSIGLGSSKIVITKQTERTLKEGYKLIGSEDGKIEINNAIFENSQTKKDLLMISDLQATKDIPVKYPETESKDPGKEALQWFSDSYKLGGKPLIKVPALKDAVNNPLPTKIIPFEKKPKESSGGYNSNYKYGKHRDSNNHSYKKHH